MSVAYEKIIQQLTTTQYTWLITGVAGFIGSHLLDTLLRLNQKVIGLDDFSTGKESNLTSVMQKLLPKQQSNLKLYRGSITSLPLCEKLMKKVDFVLHHAALCNVPLSIVHPELTHHINVTGFFNVLLAAKNAQVKRVIYASSSAVYGDLSVLPQVEDTIGNPLSPYAASKQMNEIDAKTFSICYQMATIGLRYFNVFGARQDPDGPYAAVIARWLLALKKMHPIIIYGDGETTRDFCYVANIVQANLLAAMTTNHLALNTVYNIAAGEQYSLKQLYETMIKNVATATQSKLEFHDFRPGDIRHSGADLRKAKELLGYLPSHNLAAGLKILQLES